MNITPTVEEFSIDTAPTADSIVTPFTNEQDNVDTSNILANEEEPKATNQVTDAKEDESEINLENLLDDGESETSKGRPKVQTDGLIKVIKNQIESGKLDVFDDYDEKDSLDEYLGKLGNKGLEELLESNLDTKIKDAEVKAVENYVKTLPEDLRIAAKYLSEGGDWVTIAKTLGQVQEIKTLSLDNEDDHESIVREYLRARGADSVEEIESEIEDLKDRGRLTKKAEEYKPKLDKLQDSILQQRIVEQEAAAAQRQEVAKNYIDSVVTVLKKGELNGIKLDNKLQESLYTGLTKPSYQSFNGSPTNELGYLLEKYQFGQEADMSVVAEVLYMLRDRESYRNSLIRIGENKKTEEIAKKLKTVQGTNSGVGEAQAPSNSRVVTKIQRQPKTIFSKQ